jgi:two-component system KDP operon response regulator KdpE
VPIVTLSTRKGDHEVVAAFELGADDYLTKPLGLDELVARVRVALRHAASSRAGQDVVVRLGDLEVDVERRWVTRGGRPVHLTPTEFDLLKHFVWNMDKLLTDRMLLEAVWGHAQRPEEHLLHVYIARLRRKLEPDPRSPLYLLTESAGGYRLSGAARPLAAAG